MKTSLDFLSRWLEARFAQKKRAVSVVLSLFGDVVQVHGPGLLPEGAPGAAVAEGRPAQRLPPERGLAQPAAVLLSRSPLRQQAGAVAPFFPGFVPGPER